MGRMNGRGLGNPWASFCGNVAVFHVTAIRSRWSPAPRADSVCGS